MLPQARHRLGFVLFWLSGAVTATAVAQTPASPPRAREDLAVATQQLIDTFIGVMPMAPTELRKPAVRETLAPKALPILSRIRTFVAEHPDCTLADRVHEFTVYSLVLGESGLRETLVKRQRGGDLGAASLLGAADTILSVDAEPRDKAVAAFATTLRARDAALDQASTACEAFCAAYCVSIAGDLTAAEATRLADSTKDAKLGPLLRRLAEQAARDPRLLLDKPFEVNGELSDGAKFTTRSLHGKVVLVDFWATWCGPCVKALPDLVRVRKEFADKGLAVVGVDCGSGPDKLKAFLASHPDVDWPQLVAAGDWHPAATAFGVNSIPRLFLIDRKGVLRSIDASKDLDELVRKYLGP